MEPLVSIIVPAYNASLYIEDALYSIFYQNYPNIEIIVVNDGSTDNTLEILKKYQNKVNIIDKKNEGSASARNEAILASSGKYLAYLDSDDVWLPGKLNRQISYMEENPTIGVTYGLFDKFFEQDNNKLSLSKIQQDYAALETDDIPKPVEWWSGWLYRKMLFESLPHTITVVMKKELVGTVGYFDIDLRRGQDYDYWIRLSRMTEFHKLNYKMALYRHHGENITAKCMPVNSELVVVENAIRKWGYEDIDGSIISKKAIKTRFAELNFNFAYQHFWNGDVNLAKSYFFKSVKSYPFRIKTWAYLVCSLFKTWS